MFSKTGLPAKWCQECVSEHYGVPLVMRGLGGPHVNRFQFLFSWLAVFPLTFWLRESDSPVPGSRASSGRSRTHQHERISVWKDRAQILGVFFPFCPLSPLSLPFLSFFFFGWISVTSDPVPWREVGWPEARFGRRPLPGRLRAAGGGPLGGVSDLEAGPPLCQIPDLCHTSAAACKNNYFVK